MHAKVVCIGVVSIVERSENNELVVLALRRLRRTADEEVLLGLCFSASKAKIEEKASSPELDLNLARGITCFCMEGVAEVLVGKTNSISMNLCVWIRPRRTKEGYTVDVQFYQS